jgi:predicted CoA-binding protein
MGGVVNVQEQIDRFLKSKVFGVVGASANREKFGNKVLRCYLQHNLQVIPVNPKEPTIEGIPCVSTVMELPADVTSISVITPPHVTEEVVKSAIRKGIENIWIQPGAESLAAIALCRENNINVIADGSCVLVVIGYNDN